MRSGLCGTGARFPGTAACSVERSRRLRRRVDRDRCLDVRMGLVADQLEVLEAEVEQILHLGIQLHARQRQRLAGQLQVGLLQVVGVQVAIAAGPDELARLQAGDLRHHQGQQSVAGDVEGYAEEDVRRTLVELAAELAVGDVELEQRVAGRQGHLVDQRRVPGGDDQPARVRILLQHRHQVGDLVDVAAVRRRPGAPLVAIHRAEVAVLVGPLVPDRDAVLLG